MAELRPARAFAWRTRTLRVHVQRRVRGAVEHRAPPA